MLIDIADLKNEYSSIHGLHKVVFEAQNLLFTSAAIRYTGSFTTNSTSMEGYNFSYKNFALKIIKTNKIHIETQG